MHAVATSLEDRRVLNALRAGDESAYIELHARYNTRLVALARSLGCSRAVAEEVTQDTWASVFREIHRFEGRSALKTWIFRILVNAASAQAQRERRVVPLSATSGNVIELDHARSTRATQPDEQLLWKELIGQLRVAIDGLPQTQRAVITLRDLQGWSAEEVSVELDISRGNQRVLLHRARTHVRTAITGYLDPPSTGRRLEAAA
jgi:RNA polymerase sigma-70 factor (ECF subfamily)